MRRSGGDCQAAVDQDVVGFDPQRRGLFGGGQQRATPGQVQAGPAQVQNAGVGIGPPGRQHDRRCGRGGVERVLQRDGVVSDTVALGAEAFRCGHGRHARGDGCRGQAQTGDRGVVGGVREAQVQHARRDGHRE